MMTSVATDRRAETEDAILRGFKEALEIVGRYAGMVSRETDEASRREHAARATQLAMFVGLGSMDTDPEHPLMVADVVGVLKDMERWGR
jgi:hypothetical protein